MNSHATWTSKYTMRILFLIFAALSLHGEVCTASPRYCHAYSFDSLAQCSSSARAGTEIVLDQDIACMSSATCCTEQAASLVVLHRVTDITINGNGHTLRRSDGDYKCSAVSVTEATNLRLTNITFDENEKSPPCNPISNCPSTIFISDSSNVTFDRVNIYYGKAYVVRVWHTAGFALRNSIISDAGIIGLYVGHFKYGFSSDVVVDNSIIANSRTNGLALQGAIAGYSPYGLRIVRSLFVGNHWHGLWSVKDRPQFVSSGGQILLADGTRIFMDDNIVANGNCQNCIPRGQNVSAVEVGEVAPPPAGVELVQMQNNIFLNGKGTAIHKNSNSYTKNIRIVGNRFSGFTILDSFTEDVSREDNHLLLARSREPTAHFSNTPRIGASKSPIFGCDAIDGNRSWMTHDRQCGNAGQITSMLGFSYEKLHDAVSPIYACAPTYFDVGELQNSVCGEAKNLEFLGFATR